MTSSSKVLLKSSQVLPQPVEVSCAPCFLSSTIPEDEVHWCSARTRNYGAHPCPVLVHYMLTTCTDSVRSRHVAKVPHVYPVTVQHCTVGSKLHIIHLPP